ncbi:MAG TPA: glutaminyl-peptide cyclotransferase [Spirochaetota bacterium]|nr:glutaminyl-peptide cyclotransferase [Spirochaetota bacterium]
MKKILFLWLLFFYLPGGVVHLKYKVTGEIPHYGRNFTQGLLYTNGFFYESTGLKGRSSLKCIDINTGKVIRQYLLEENFAEGLALKDNHLLQLTWKAGKAYLYDINDFKLQDIIYYRGEGWGITTAPEGYYMTDGSSYVWLRSFAGFKLRKRIKVTLHNIPVKYLNELEYINGYLYANIWRSDRIVAIDPEDGVVVKVLDLEKLAQKERNNDRDAVLNGIAYNKQKKLFYITGKKWKYIYKLKIM